MVGLAVWLYGWGSLYEMFIRCTEQLQALHQSAIRAILPQEAMNLMYSSGHLQNINGRKDLKRKLHEIGLLIGAHSKLRMDKLWDKRYWSLLYSVVYKGEFNMDV